VPLIPNNICHHSSNQQLQVDAATLQVCLQLFAQSGLEKAAFADMETLSNHMGLFLQVPYTSRNFCLRNPETADHRPVCKLKRLQEQFAPPSRS